VIYHLKTKFKNSSISQIKLNPRIRTKGKVLESLPQSFGVGNS
jgi:hypothetical protein